MKVPRRKSKWFSPMWLRITRYQRIFRYSDWAWLVTPAKMREYDRVWLEWAQSGGDHDRSPVLRDFA